MPAKERLRRYLDIELPEEQLLFHVSMVISLLVCFFMMLFTMLIRMSIYVPLMLFAGILMTVAAMYVESIIVRIDLISAGFLFLMFFILLPLMSRYVPYAFYDFPIYFLTGIVFIAVLFKKKRSVILVLLVSVIDICCIYNMMLKTSDSVSPLMDTQYRIILFCRIVVSLLIMGTICGVLTAYRSKVLRRGIKKSIAMEKQAEQLSYAKNMFLVNVSHEIRTPLNAILGVTELLLDQDADDRIKESAFHMANSSRALLSITNELMDFSTLDDGNPVVTNKQYYIEDIFNELINVISVRFADYKTELFVDISPDIPEILIGDASLVRQVMLNILAGVVSSLMSGEVYLQISKEDSAEDRIRLMVEVRAEGTFRYSYRESLYHEQDMGVTETYESEMTGDEMTVPLPYRLVQLMGGETYMEEENHKRRYFFNILQGYESGKALIENTAGKHYRVLFYENTISRSSLFAKALYATGIDFCQADNDDTFLKECVDSAYTHLMIASEKYRGLKDKLSELLCPQSIILIGSDMMIYDDALIRTTFARPVNCLNLNALFCGKQNSTIRHIGYKGGFICPNVHVMVVDDNIVNLEVATSFLNRYQAKVSLATSGKECIKMLQKESVDLILLDYMMPEMDGIDTLKNIRALGDPRLEKVPVAALTANAVSGAREMFLEAGFSEYISKPIEREKFEKVLRSCLPSDKIIYITDKEEKAE